MSLRGNNLTFKYFEQSKKHLFDKLDFNVPKGKITLLTGSSGSGKSTLAYILAGLYPKNAGVLVTGSVTVDGISLTTLTPDKRVKYVTMMFQNPDLQFCMNNLKQELHFCLENIETKEDEIIELSNEAVRTLEIEHLKTIPFCKMSGGEKQKCALACIFALKSQYIILDEAFANIDPNSARFIIEKLYQMNVTVLAIDHNIDLWEGRYDHIISLDGVETTTFDLKVKLHSIGSPIIIAENLVVNGIPYPNIVIKKGSINAIVGRSGSGKTTLFKTLIKQYKYEGSLTLDEVEVRMITKKKLFARCGIVFQNPSNQFLALRVFDEVLFSVKHSHEKKTTQWHKEKTMELLAMFKLDAHKNYTPYMLSQGQQRRLAVLTMIAGAQDILLLDEPTYGQDYENIYVMMKLLLEKAKSGLTVIFATHNMAVAENFSHQIIKVGN